MKKYKLYDKEGIQVGEWTETESLTQEIKKYYTMTVHDFVMRCKKWNHPQGNLVIE